jgi:hypothetical protein
MSDALGISERGSSRAPDFPPPSQERGLRSSPLRITSRLRHERAAVRIRLSFLAAVLLVFLAALPAGAQWYWSTQYFLATPNWQQATPGTNIPTQAPVDVAGAGDAAGYTSQCSDGQGMATWAVTEPLCCLWLYDVPVSYQPGRGPRLDFLLLYKSLQGSAVAGDLYGFGPRWMAPFTSFLTVDTKRGQFSQLTMNGRCGNIPLPFMRTDPFTFQFRPNIQNCPVSSRSKTIDRLQQPCPLTKCR